MKGKGLLNAGINFAAVALGCLAVGGIAAGSDALKKKFDKPSLIEDDFDDDFDDEIED